MPGSMNQTKFTANSSIVLAFFVALIFPAGYFSISYQYATGSLEAGAEIDAQNIVRVIASTDPDLRHYDRDLLKERLSRRPHGHNERRRLLDRDGVEIAAIGDSLKAPIIRRSRLLGDKEKVAGILETSRSLLPILKESAIVALLGLGIGMLVFILLPFKAISRANGQLRDSFSFLTRVMESSVSAIIVIDLAGTIEMVNGRCAEMTGYQRSALCGMHIQSLFSGSTAAEVLQELKRVYSGAAEVVKFEANLFRSNGTTVTISCGAAPVHQEGRIASVVLSVEDIMEQRQAVEQLKQTKEYTENLIQAASVIIVGLDLDGAVTLFNRTAEEVTGYGFAELSGKNWLQSVMSQESTPQPCSPPGPALEAGCRDAFENQVVIKNGATRTISWRNSPIMESGKKVGTLCFGIDITEHRKIEAQLRQSQKMECVGQLAGGVAHDFNNMLSVILGYAQLCEVELAESDLLRPYIQEISKAGVRSRDMVRQLLAFSRKEIISPQAINLNAHCIETERTLSRLIGEEIRLTFLPSTSLWRVKIDPSQADQILMNLAVNARDAMPGGGDLTIMTGNALISEADCDYRLDAKPGDYTCLTVRDTGTGMDVELVKRIFEPFFTTKDVGKGTGLGLATVYGIVTQNGGFIDVESEPGKGTTFRIYLPRLPDEPELETPVVADEVLIGSGTILMVEDDDMMRVMATQMLEKIGYQVIPAEDPRRAISICQEGLPIDLVITDVVMPGMNGRELAQGIAAHRPELPVLFMSGHSTEILAKQGVLDQGMHYIQKPFDMEGLHSKIRQIREPVAAA